MSLYTDPDVVRDQPRTDTRIDVALIPPLSLLETQEQLKQTKYYLVLPQLLNQHKRYRNYFLDRNDKYLILDNGAAEAYAGTNDDDLLKLAMYIGASEVAAPDILFDGDTTRERCLAFLRTHLCEKYIESGGVVGYVAQGSSVPDALDHFCRLWEVPLARDNIRTIFLPRLLVSKNDLSGRINLADFIHRVEPDLDIHFFGASRYWASEIRKIRDLVPFVRSIDTSLPYTATYLYTTLHAGKEEQAPRPVNYFDLGAGLFEQSLLYANINQYLAWAGFKPNEY